MYLTEAEVRELFCSLQRELGSAEMEPRLYIS
jgi:hypothetical protein